MHDRKIFSWDEIDTYRLDERKVRTKVVDGEHMQAVWAEIRPGGRYRMHSHPHEQFSFMLKGRLRLTVGDETREIGPGDMWHAPPNVEHGGEVIGDEAVVFVDAYSPPSKWIAEALSSWTREEKV